MHQIMSYRAALQGPKSQATVLEYTEEGGWKFSLDGERLKIKGEVNVRHDGRVKTAVVLNDFRGKNWGTVLSIPRKCDPADNPSSAALGNMKLTTLEWSIEWKQHSDGEPLP